MIKDQCVKCSMTSARVQVNQDRYTITIACVHQMRLRDLRFVLVPLCADVRFVQFRSTGAHVKRGRYTVFLVCAHLACMCDHTPVLSACPLHTNSGCGKERRILIGPW